MTDRKSTEILVRLQSELAQAHKRVSMALAGEELSDAELGRQFVLSLNGEKKGSKTNSIDISKVMGVVTPAELASIDLTPETYGPFRFDPNTNILQVDYLDRDLVLGPAEAQVFLPYIKFPERVIAHLEMCRHLKYPLGSLSLATNNTRNRVLTIRKKIQDNNLGSVGNPKNKYLHTITGVGIMLKVYYEP